MFDQYFHPRTTSRLLASPDASWLVSYLQVLHHRGYARLTIQCYLRQAEQFGHWLQTHRRTLLSVRDADVLAFATRNTDGTAHVDARAAGYRLLEHLREHGLVPPEPPSASPAIEREVAAYDEHLRTASGLALATRRYRQRFAREFLIAVFGHRPIRWSQIRVEGVRAFLAAYGQTGRTATAPLAAGSLRSFFRWLEFQGRISPQVTAAVPAIRRRRRASVPALLTDDQVAAILATFDRSTPVGRRDHAMILCLMQLGLRVGEIESLTVGDLDSVTHTVRLACGKPRRERLLPLPPRVERALLDYIRRDRPTTTDTHLFLRHRLPVGIGVSRELVRSVLRRAFAQVPGCESLTGTHILRHTAASRLMRAGADLKRIADILGHRSIDTTATYTQIDFESLAEVARLWPTEGVQP